MTTKTKGLILSVDQEAARKAILRWWAMRTDQVRTLGGYAGTGKTTSVSAVVDSLRRLHKGKKRLRIAFMCLAGKASSVLRTKLKAADALEHQDYCGTIHGLIYEPRFRNEVVIGWRLKDTSEVNFDLFILDEASMIGQEQLDHLKSFGYPILAIGDHGQLPPIEGKLNLMENPDLKLEKIHRQAADNPIIKLSIMARQGIPVPVGKHGEFVTKVRERNYVERVPDPATIMFICGTNKTRTSLNRTIRRRLGFKLPTPQVGEKVICLKNNSEKEIYNGLTGTIKLVRAEEKEHYNMRVSMDGWGDDYLDDFFWKQQFGAAKTCTPPPGRKWGDLGCLFDFGYALTCHKAQGSEARRVMVFEECWWLKGADLQRRWLYTAYTRAQERLLIVGT